MGREGAWGRDDTWAVALMFAVAVSFAIGCCAGYNGAEGRLRKAAISQGYGHYVVDPDTGDVRFVFKNRQE